MRVWVSILLCLFWTCDIIAQKNILLQPINLPKSAKGWEASKLLQYISETNNLVFSYNASAVNVTTLFTDDTPKSTIKDVLDQLFPASEYIILTIPPNKIIIQSIPKQVEATPTEQIISGYVKDAKNGESIYGAIVIDRKSNKVSVTNEDGYFTMKVKNQNILLEINHLGYTVKKISAKTINVVNATMYIENDNELPAIIIDAKSKFNLYTSGEIIDIFQSEQNKSIIGERDIIHNTRILPSVQSGGEGQSGLYVRGGSPDQNLTLLDGVAFYEVNHVAGISSIFMDESIKEASFISNGFPGRFSGRLSSVLDIQLKDGDKVQPHASFSAGLPGGKIHLNGPIFKNKTTYNISARASWINLYVNNFLKEYTRYNDINIRYSDFLGRVAHYFSPTTHMSLTVYGGSDKLELTKVDTFYDQNYALRVYDKNGLNWGNKMASLKFNTLIGSKISAKFQAGIIQYDNGSRSSYLFETVKPDTTTADELDVISLSNVKDINVRFDAEYYLSDIFTIKLGSNTIKHNFNPSIRQSLVILEGEAANIIDKDSATHSIENNIYLENNINISTNLFIYTGLNYATFTADTKTYSSLQPRFKIMWSPFAKHVFTASYSKMGQFVHLLTNPGLGLPSDLWVPSTDNIKPQYSNQWSFNYNFAFAENTYTSLSVYTKNFSNSLEYTQSIDLFYFLINNQSLVPLFNTSKDWERNLYVGATKSRGIEWLLHRKSNNHSGWASVSYSKTTRVFPDINQGVAFPATYDRTIDINFGYTFQWSSRLKTGVNFVYGTGNTFSLATEAFDSFLGITLLNSDGRNNYRLPAFHQLSLHANYKLPFKNYDAALDFTIYNVYNRLNAYFIYIYKNPQPPNETYLRKVSILPFTPSLHFSIKF